jgi:hypothetical protein
MMAMSPALRKLAPALGAGGAGVVVIWLGGLLGWWWLTPLVGLALGLALSPTRRALLVALIAGGLGWGLPLALLALSAPVAPLAAAVEGVVGLPAAGGALVVLVTLLVGAGLSVVGAWVGTTGKQLVPDYDERARALYAGLRMRITRPGRGPGA